ncbi:MAG: formyltransferase family protein, partial [Candidatus Nanoarchaeia archaeon]
YMVSVIFSDNPRSNAMKIGEEYGIPVVEHDIKLFYQSKGKPITDMGVREEFDGWTVESLGRFDVDVVAYAGYMKVVTQPLMDAFLGVNVHPADLSLTGVDGVRKYRGAHAVKDALVAGEREIRSTTHIVESEVDGGRILMVSPPVRVDLPMGFDLGNKKGVEHIAERYQDRLKEVGDWVVFPKTLEYMADGKFLQDEETGELYFDDKPIPKGYRLGG